MDRKTFNYAIRGRGKGHILGIAIHDCYWTSVAGLSITGIFSIELHSNLASTPLYPPRGLDRSIRRWQILAIPTKPIQTFHSHSNSVAPISQLRITARSAVARLRQDAKATFLLRGRERRTTHSHKLVCKHNPQQVAVAKPRGDISHSTDGFCERFAR